MRVLIIGAKGQLGTALCDVYQDADVIQADRDGGECVVDICDRESVRDILPNLIRGCIYRSRA